MKRRPFRMLWAGIVEAARACLDGVLGKDRARCRSHLEELYHRLRARGPQIACHAAHRALGPRVSCNWVEKDSELVVSSRQKHNETGWSRQGAGRSRRSPRRA